MSDKGEWLRNQLSSAQREVGGWDRQKRDTLRTEVSARFRGTRSNAVESRESASTRRASGGEKE